MSLQDYLNNYCELLRNYGEIIEKFWGFCGFKVFWDFWDFD